MYDEDEFLALSGIQHFAFCDDSGRSSISSKRGPTTC